METVYQSRAGFGLLLVQRQQRVELPPGFLPSGFVTCPGGRLAAVPKCEQLLALAPEQADGGAQSLRRLPVGWRLGQLHHTAEMFVHGFERAEYARQYA